MIRIELSPEPQWFERGHGVRLQLMPLTTALMVATRSDPEVQIEGLKDRPERQEGVDAFWCDFQHVTVSVANTFPIHYGAAGEGCGEHSRPAVVAGIGLQRLHRRVRPGRHHQRGGQRQKLQPHTVAKVKPLRFGGKIDPDHG